MDRTRKDYIEEGNPDPGMQKPIFCFWFINPKFSVST